MNCQSASAAVASAPISPSSNWKTVASSKRCPLKCLILSLPKRPPLAILAKSSSSVSEKCSGSLTPCLKISATMFGGSNPVSSAKKQNTMRLRNRAMRRFFRCATECSRRVFASASSIDNVGIFERLMGEIGLRRGQSGGKVRDRSSLATMQLRFDLVRKHGTRPAVIQGSTSVPKARIELFNFLHQHDVVPPRQRSQ